MHYRIGFAWLISLTARVPANAVEVREQFLEGVDAFLTELLVDADAAVFLRHEFEGQFDCVHDLHHSAFLLAEQDADHSQGLVFRLEVAGTGQVVRHVHDSQGMQFNRYAHIYSLLVFSFYN